MPSKRQISTWLALERGEGRSASLMMAHAFCMGLATVFFETAASALFLTRYPAAAIPVVYIVAALVSTAAGLGYARLERRVPFWPLMSGTLTFLLVTVLMFRVAISVTGASLVIAALFVWYRLLSILTDVEYWAVATRLYDVQQSKRLFGLIGSGEVTARMAGSFSIPLLVRAMGAKNLLVLSSLALLACLLLLAALRSEEPAAPRKTKESTKKKRRTLSSLLADPYVRAIIAVAALGILGKHFVDFSFLQQMQSRYPDANRLASFFGIFTGLTQAINLLIRVTISRPFLQRFGIAGGLQTLPVIHLLCTSVLLIVAVLHPSGAAVFWLVIANQGIYKTLKHPIDNPSVKVLYQPLQRDTRLAVQVLNELIATPLMIGVAGVVMLILTRLIRFDIRTFTVVMLTTFVLWILASRGAHRGFVQALRDALQKRAVDPETLHAADEGTFDAIRAHALSAHPAEATYAISLLERGGDSQLASTLQAATGHPSPIVRQFACDRLGAIGDPASIARLIELARSDDDPVASSALQALQACAPDRALVEARTLPLSGEGERTAAAIRVLVARGNEADREVARTHVERLSDSLEPAARVAACRMIGRSGYRPFASVAERLLSDSRSEVRRAALEASSHVSDRAAELAVRLLDDHDVRSAAISILVAAGDASVPALEQRLTEGSDARTTQRILRIAGRIGTPSALAMVTPHLHSRDEDVREQALQSLVTANERVSAVEKTAIEAGIRRDALEAIEEWSLLSALPHAKELTMVRSALSTEADRARQRILMGLQLLDDSEAMARARRQLQSTSREKRAYAGELLEASLPPRLRSAVLPLFRAHPRASTVQDPVTILRKIIDGPAFTSWTKACAERALEVLGGPLIPEQKGHASMNDTIEKVIILKSVGFFATTPDDVLAQLAIELEPVHAAADEAIIRKGDVDDSLYIIASGEVRVHDGETTLAHLAEREVFGELAVLDPEPRSASVTAQTDVELFRLNRDDLFEILPDHAEMLSGILHVLCNRLRTAR